VNYERWEELGAVHSLSGDFFECYKNYGELVDETERHIYIDALFGIGLTRPLPHILTDIVYSWDFDSKVVNGSKFVAIDVPSGLDADAGEEIDPDNSEGPLPVVNLTVTFHSLKPGHIKKYGPHHCGKTVVKDIGL
jgi:NAD(P)H-hydrate repair Nnr-like enzyme with NAD(P)H-hydrate epimerase domain